MSNQNKSFMDSRTILAILLVGVVWFGWQQYLTSKYGEMTQTPPPATDTAQTAPTGETAAVAAGAAAPAAAKIAPSKTETTIPFEDENWSLVFTSKGMGLRQIHLKKFTDRADQRIALGSEKAPHPFETRLLGSNEGLDFEMKKVSDTEILGVAKTPNAVIKKTYRLEPKNYTIRTFIAVENILPGYAGISNYISEVVITDLEKVPPGKKVANDVAAWQQYYVAHGTTHDRNPTAPEKPLQAKYTNVSIGAMTSHYFSVALVDRSNVAPTFETAEKDGNFLGVMTHESVPNAVSQQIELSAFAGPKAIEILRRADPRLPELVDFGWFSWIAEPILNLMRALYEMVHNWGWAIILLTLIVRLVVLPFNIMSYKSMKVMQAIQPQMNAIREKYKSDPQTQQIEIMRLMKEKKANPIGGCLPMLLQLPVFFALYRMLDQSIELYKAPFALWIHDLSMKDPYYVLPALMGISMYFQQKITPTTMDPAQAKVMQFMPVVFTFLMVNLPSGLNLYIFVSTLFGVVQQLAFMKDRKQQPSSIRAQA